MEQQFGDGAAQSGKAVAIDAAGGVFVTGDLAGSIDFGGGALMSAGGTDVFLASFTTTGAYVWAKRFGDARCRPPAGSRSTRWATR